MRIQGDEADDSEVLPRKALTVGWLLENAQNFSKSKWLKKFVQTFAGPLVL